MSNTEEQNIGTMIEKIKTPPEEAQRRLSDTAAGMIMAVEAMKEKKERAESARV